MHRGHTWLRDSERPGYFTQQVHLVTRSGQKLQGVIFTNPEQVHSGWQVRTSSYPGTGIWISRRQSYAAAHEACIFRMKAMLRIIAAAVAAAAQW